MLIGQITILINLDFQGFGVFLVQISTKQMTFNKAANHYTL